MVAEPLSIIVNEVVGGRYRLCEVIGRGGTSSVYCAQDQILGREVALKLFAPQAPAAEALKRQEVEIKLLATLNHPSLVTLFDAGIDTRIPEEPRPFLTMELVEGHDLRSRIRHSPVPLDEVAVIGAGIAAALTYVHSVGIVHRDIKPANILLVQIRPGEPLRAKLTDFGIARIADGTRLTATGAMVGTAAYLSPEQAMGSPLTPATDVYSLGLVLLECITQAIEYPGGAVESAVARLHRVPRIPGDLPAEWADLIRSMTAIEPLDRPTSVEVETALRHALVSPASTPGDLAPQTTRILPARHFSPPSVTSESPNPDLSAASVLPADDASRQHAGARLTLTGGQASSPPGAGKAGRTSRAGRPGRLLLVAILVLVTLAGAAVAITTSFAPPASPAVVPYPAVTGTLGDHLQELQKSVEP